jgi:hypothetical protein
VKSIELSDESLYIGHVKGKEIPQEVDTSSEIEISNVYSYPKIVTILEKVSSLHT